MFHVLIVLCKYISFFKGSHQKLLYQIALLKLFRYQRICLLILVKLRANFFGASKFFEKRLCKRLFYQKFPNLFRIAIFVIPVKDASRYQILSLLFKSLGVKSLRSSFLSITIFFLFLPIYLSIYLSFYMVIK